MPDLPTLYPADPGSPFTTLAAPYTTGDTAVTLTDASTRPAAPNLLCLEGAPGSGVLLYTGIDGNTLTGISQIEGPTGTWPAGSYAYRGFTAYDHDTLQEHLDALEAADPLPDGTRGDLLAHNGVAWAPLAPGTEGQVLQTGSPGADPAWADLPDGLHRNAIINGNFDIWQRGTSFNLAADVYTADRWSQRNAGAGTSTVTRQAFSPGELAGASYYLRLYTETLGAITYRAISQRIEDVRTFAGQTVTLSLWLRASAPMTVGIDLRQIFGSGGSAPVTNLQNVNIGTSWARYSLTYDIASISGKTIETGNYLWLLLNATPTTDGQYTDIAQVQLNIGDKPLPFAPRPIAEELALCQRYFERIGGTGIPYKGYCIGYIASTTAAGAHLPFMVTKRGVPTISFSGQTHFDARAPAGAFAGSGILAQTPSADGVDLTLTITGAITGESCIIRDRNSGNSYIDVDAEL